MCECEHKTAVKLTCCRIFNNLLRCAAERRSSDLTRGSSNLMIRGCVGFWEIPFSLSTFIVVAAMGVSKVCLVLLLVELSLCSSAFSYSHRLWKRQSDGCGPTPINLQQSFLASCTGMSGLDSATCNQAWMSFVRAFAHKDPTRVMARLIIIFAVCLDMNLGVQMRPAHCVSIAS